MGREVVGGRSIHACASYAGVVAWTHDLFFGWARSLALRRYARRVRRARAQIRRCTPSPASLQPMAAVLARAVRAALPE